MINNTPINSYINGRENRFSSSCSKRSARIILNKELSSSLNKNAKISAKKNLIMNNSDISMKKPAEVNFCGFSGSKFKQAWEKFKAPIAKWFYKSKNMKTVLEFIDDQQLVFGAAFALFLTCILRPASIMVLPSKKNKDNQKYASAHSIASGIIGFAISTVLFMPIGNATKKIKKHSEKYFTDPNSYLRKNKNSEKVALKYIDRLPDILGSVPKGILTIALIPPILKYVFGWEKKKNENANQQAQKTESIAKGGLK